MTREGEKYSALRALKASATKSKAAKFREAMPEIEDAIQAGATIDQLRDALEKDGLKLTKSYLKKLLYLHRKRYSKNIPPRASQIKHNPEQATAIDEEVATDETSMTEEQIRRKELLAKVDSIPSDYESLKKYSQKVMKEIEKSGETK